MAIVVVFVEGCANACAPESTQTSAAERRRLLSQERVFMSTVQGAPPLPNNVASGFGPLAMMFVKHHANRGELLLFRLCGMS
jgi:hypothetical protein